MSERPPIAVRILGREYLIKNDAEAANVERAAGLVDATMEKIRRRTGRVDSLHVAVLAALNMANRLIALRDEAGTARGQRIDAERARGLIELIESVLRADIPPPH